jgi:predicted peptidase
MITRIATALVVIAGLGLAEPPAGAFLEQTVEVAGKERRFRLLTPLASPQDAPSPAPVILFLHGAGERGTDNLAQLKHFPEKMAQPEWRAKYRCFLIAPQCEPDKQWVDAPWGDKQSKPMAAEPSEMLRVAIATLEKVRAEHKAAIDPARIYVTGLSMGGYGTWELAMRHPEWFAAAAPICGGGDEARAGRLASLPVWAFHGKGDTVVWPERSERMVAAVTKAGGQAKLSLLPGVGHDAWSPAYDLQSGLLDWLFAQKRPAARP